MIYEKIDCAELILDINELAARLSVRPGETVRDIDRYIDMIKSVAVPMYAAKHVHREKRGDGMYIGDIYTASRGFMTVADGYSSCILLVVTLGLGVDKVIMRESAKSPSSAFILDAVADAYAEALCRYAEKKVTRGARSAPGIAPGYADLELSVGEKIVKEIGADKLLGIRFTESGLMIPRKSISTIICTNI